MKNKHTCANCRRELYVGVDAIKVEDGVIGTKDFVDRLYLQFKSYFSSKHEKRPKSIRGVEGVFSLKRLSEAI